MMPGIKADPIVPIPPATMLSNEQSSALINDTTFRGRVKVSLFKFSNYVMDEDPKTLAHNTRLKYANRVFASPDMETAQIMGPVVMDGGVQQSGSDITDNALQSSVEAVIGKFVL